MSVQVESLEKNMAKLTIELGPEKLEDAIERAYLSERDRIRIPGFRKGKVPRKMVEKMYGEGFFYEDAANTLIQENYPDAVKESGEDIVSRPNIEIVRIKEGEPFVFTAEVAVRPGVTLGQYKGIEVTRANVEVTDEEVDERIGREREENSRMIVVKDRPAREGDIVSIDFEGSVGGEPFEGGSATNYSLELGSHSFIAGFEEQLVGRESGDDVEVSVTFPENYQERSLAGKPAIFKVRLNEIREKELPELDDEFAQDVSEFDTFEEYKEDVRGSILEEKKADARRAQEDEAIRAIIDGSEMEIPDAMIDTQCDAVLSEFEGRIRQNGLSLNQYLQFSGITMKQLREQAWPEAETRIKSSLVLEQIVKEEGIEATEEEVEKEIEDGAKIYGITPEKYKELFLEDGDGDESDAMDGLRRNIQVNKAVKLVMDNVVEVEGKEAQPDGAEG